MGLRQLRSRIPHGVLPWMAACVLLLIGTLSALVGVLHIPDTELASANVSGQHLVIDPATGAVVGLLKKAEDAEKPSETGASAEASAEHAVEAPAATADTAHDAPKESPEPSANASAPAEPAAETPVTPNAQNEHAAEPAVPASATPTPSKPDDPAAADQLTPNPANAPTLATVPATRELPAIPPSNESIVSPGAKEITEEKNGLLLPKLGENGASASRLYAKNIPAKPEVARLSVVITDAGFNAQSIATILKLPHSVTIAISPYAPDAGKTIALLHMAGFETWAMLPMMGEKYPSNDPGPLGIIASLPPEELTRRLHTSMATTLGSVGFVFPADEALSPHMKVFAPTLTGMTNRGLLALSTHPTHTIDALSGKNKPLAASLKRADIVIDANAAPAEIQSKLDGLQARLVSQPRLILVVPARPNILTLLGDWLKVNGQGTATQIMPLSSMYSKETAPAAEENKDGEQKKNFEKSSGAKPTSKPAATEKH